MSRIRSSGSRIFEKLLRESGIDFFNGAQGRILYVLWQSGSMNITQISKQTSLTKSTLTKMLDRMEGIGLIRRVQDAGNRRQTIIEITEVAKSYSDQYKQVSDKMNDYYYNGFSKEEIVEFEKQLVRILKNLEETEL